MARPRPDDCATGLQTGREQTAADLPSAPHFLRVRASANPANYSTYGSLGAYTVTGTFVRVVRLTGFQEPLTTSPLTPGRTLPVKFTLTDAVAAARVLLLPSAVAGPDEALAETSCKGQTQGRQYCNLNVPATLVRGATTGSRRSSRTSTGIG